MNSIKVCEYSRSRSFHDDLILQDQASGERSQDQWSSGILFCSMFRQARSNQAHSGDYFANQTRPKTNMEKEFRQ